MSLCDGNLTNNAFPFLQNIIIEFSNILNVVNVNQLVFTPYQTKIL